MEVGEASGFQAEGNLEAGSLWYVENRNPQGKSGERGARRLGGGVREGSLRKSVEQKRTGKQPRREVRRAGSEGVWSWEGLECKHSAASDGWAGGSFGSPSIHDFYLDLW